MKKVSAKRYDREGLGSREELVADESCISVKINGQNQYKGPITPKSLKYFVLGFLYGEGYINSEKDLSALSFKRTEDCLLSEVRIEESENEYRGLSEPVSIAEFRLSGREKAKEKGITGEAILRGCKRALERTEEFTKTGAYHYGYLVDLSGSVKKRALDIGRHNAVDKAIGKGLLSGVNFNREFVFTTGRISTKMVLKCVRCNISLIVSQGAPFYEAIKLGRKYGVCVIGFLRGERFNVYSRFDFIE